MFKLTPKYEKGAVLSAIAGFFSGSKLYLFYAKYNSICDK